MTVVDVNQPLMVGNGWRIPGDKLRVMDPVQLKRLLESGRVSVNRKTKTAYTLLANRNQANAKSKRIIFSCCLAGGDIVALSGALRDFHAAYPHIEIATNTSYPDIFEHCQFADFDVDKPADVCEVGYNGFAPDWPHIVEAFRRDIARIVGVPRFRGPNRGEICLNSEERLKPAGRPYWVVMAGGKFDISTKWYPHWQQVIDATPGVRWIQCGAAGQNHKPLRGVESRVGSTTVRELVRLIYHAQGVLCGITMAMHLAGAMGKRAVVIRGGRENISLCSYPGHVLFDSLGTLDCCKVKPCWRSTSHTDSGPENDRCLNVVHVRGTGYAECMHRVDPLAVAYAVTEIANASQH